MKDRVPANPGRVLITPENGAAAYYATMTRADNPTQQGDPLNKNTLLKDATAALFGMGADAVPDDVFAAIKSVLNAHESSILSGPKIATGSYVGTGKCGESNPNSLTFSFTPQIIIIYRTERQTPTSTSSSVARLGYWGAHFAILTRGTTWMAATSGSHDSAATRLTWRENGVSWYNEYAYSGGELTQWNYSNIKYNYIAIG